MASACKRIETDVMKLLMSDYEVTLADNDVREFYVRFYGPEDSFVNRIFHPNIDEISGSVCLDVINQTWSPMFDMVNIFEVFLPQLLRYPNPSDPLNGEAASLLIRDPSSYEMKVKDHVMRYASLASDPNVSSAEVKLLHSDDEDSLLCLSDQDLEDLSL